MLPLDPDHCYVAVQSRDQRFDGWFVTAVRTTGIYCRPSCPAITPKRTNVDFFATAATAQQHGFRACKRCRPDASPGSPEWNVRQDVVARAMRLIADGFVEREGVPGLARRLGYSERHLNRVLTDELGAGPLAIARAQRAHTARLLVETTTMPLTDIAFAAGFGSVRQFNDTIREVFATSPTALRTSRHPKIRSEHCAERNARSEFPAGVSDGVGGGWSTIAVRLPVRRPFAAEAVMAFIGERAIGGTESWDRVTYRRSLDLPGGSGVVSLVANDDHVAARLALTSWGDLAAAVQRIRRLLDLDADPTAVDEALSGDPVMRALVTAVPGRRSPASVDAFETAVRAVIGQQVSVAGARTVAGRIVEAVGTPIDAVDTPIDAVNRLFPRPEQLLAARDEAFSMPHSRRDTIRRLAAAVLAGDVELHVGADPAVAREQLLRLRGVGPWTADYVVMRGLGHPDMFLDSDLGVRHALASIGVDADHAHGWAPWRSYAVHHLWASLSPIDPSGRTTP
ncbi:MAG TPA: Ada metal-binding domain-containing protein [Ilumatobacteraceae bacterium]|nr:Ada metal-binding domain-containing protein [Ilumatobacteraceae bacterium]